MPKRVLQGVVVSNKTQKTVTVLVERKFLHPVYKKTVRSSKKYAAHDETNQYKVGDIVRIQESRPLSKTKKWVAIEKLGSKNVDTTEDQATA
jgi:small subunit ribosomal protein S17